MAHQVNVSDQFRKNELSLTPGGATIKVITANQKVMVYDKIKRRKG
jgi:ribosome-associated protein YbcJ (S4-like RNA binding protein)